MDVNAKLDEVRHAIGRAQMFQGMGSTGANYVWALERAADAFTVLDAHLSAGGTPPEEWREGPDAAGGAPGGFAQGAVEYLAGAGAIPLRGDDYMPAKDAAPCHYCHSPEGAGHETDCPR